MAKISFDDAQKIASTNQFSDIKYFGLKNDGDEALVRIMHDSVEDFEILTVHEVTNANGKKYKVNCLRDINDPLDMCPLCDSGSAQSRKIYVHLIQYTKDPLSGQVTAEPFYWEKPLGFATELKTLITEYGPLSTSLFKIKRNGAPGDRSTRYTIMYAPPSIYDSHTYAPHPELFEGHTAAGERVANKTYEELLQLAKPAAPAATPTSAAPAASIPAAPIPAAHAEPTLGIPAAHAEPTPRTYTPTPANAYSSMGDDIIPRPKRIQ